MKHTLGPWRIRPRMSNDYCQSIISGELAIATVEEHWEKGEGKQVFPKTEEAEANARLMAAAPELLESLIMMVDTHERHIGGRPGPDDVADRWDKARAAIEKATGEDLDQATEYKLVRISETGEMSRPYIQGSYNVCLIELQKIQPHSWHHAMKYEGWKITQAKRGK